ncbi:MAG: universal stress protein [Candidatus Bathyarchaeota archaeon]
MIKKILVAIDGSQSADNALDFSLDLAKKYSAEVLIVSVIDSPEPSLTAKGMFYAPNTTEDYLKRLRKFHNKILLDARNKSKKINPKLKVSTRLLRGRPADRIVEIAKEMAFDLIVVGNRGLGGIKEFILGSVSDRIADHASSPVLIVK